VKIGNSDDQNLKKLLEGRNMKLIYLERSKNVFKLFFLITPKNLLIKGTKHKKCKETQGKDTRVGQKTHVADPKTTPGTKAKNNNKG
jgi:hypothetical protein